MRMPEPISDVRKAELGGVYEAWALEALIDATDRAASVETLCLNIGRWLGARIRRGSSISLTLVAAISSCSAAAFGAMGLKIFGQLREAQIKTTRLDAAAVRNALELYQADHDALPASLSELVPHYLREQRPDCWGTPYRYLVGPGVIAVAAAGPDREFGTDDDITTYATRLASPKPDRLDSEPERKP
jgi:hypothetical protein